MGGFFVERCHVRRGSPALGNTAASHYQHSGKVPWGRPVRVSPVLIGNTRVRVRAAIQILFIGGDFFYGKSGNAYNAEGL